MASLERIVHAAPDISHAVLKRSVSEKEPGCLAAKHLVLGTALRLRALREKDHRKIRTYLQIIEAFEAALGIFVESFWRCWESVRPSKVEPANWMRPLSKLTGERAQSMRTAGVALALAGGAAQFHVDG